MFCHGHHLNPRFPWSVTRRPMAHTHVVGKRHPNRRASSCIELLRHIAGAWWQSSNRRHGSVRRGCRCVSASPARRSPRRNARSPPCATSTVDRSGGALELLEVTREEAELECRQEAMEGARDAQIERAEAAAS